MADDPWRWFVALDGGDLDGLIGCAGLLRFDWPQRRVTHRYYDGISGGHNVSIAPSGKTLLLGNFSQQVVVVDAASLEVLARKATMGIEECDYRLRSNTHHLWRDDRRFIAAIGDHLYELDAADLAAPATLLGAHRLWTAHELRWTRDQRYLLMGDLGPEDSGARQVGIFDLQTKEPTVIRLPGTVWHTAVHPEKNLGYAATYSFASEDDDYLHWAPAYGREYIFEIDLEQAIVTRVWSSGAEFPIHLNSDLELWVGDQPKLYVSSGGSHTVVEVDLGDFASNRVVRVMPNAWSRFWSWRQRLRNVLGALLRKSFFNATHFILQTYCVTGGRSFDGVYCARVSPDGRYLVAGNRGYNYLRVMDRATLATAYATRLPTMPSGLHLGLHHSEMAAGSA